MFQVKKFHKYLYDRGFSLITDHKPLTVTFNVQTTTLSIVALRMQRWSFYFFNTTSCTGSQRTQQCRCPIAFASDLGPNDPVEDTSILQVPNVEVLPVTSNKISMENRRNTTLSKAMSVALNGWPTSVQDKELRTKKNGNSSQQTKAVLYGGAKSL